MGAEKVMGLERPVETGTSITETATPDPQPKVEAKYDVTAPECFDNAAHVLQQTNADADVTYSRVAVASEWRRLGEAVNRRDVERYVNGLR